MKIRNVILAAMLILGSPIIAAESNFDKLNKQYITAVDRATAPINKTYVENLKRLLADAAKRGDTKEVEVINTELSKFTKSDNSTLSSQFIGTEWICSNHVFKFNKNGIGEKVHASGTIPFTWRKLDDGRVEVTGRDALESKPKSWTFTFNYNTKDFFLVDGEDRLKKAITPK